jgi:WD40 repeat protein
MGCDGSLANSVVLRGHDKSVTAVAISPDNRWVVTSSSDNTTRIWDLRAKDPSTNPLVLSSDENPVWHMTISPDNHWLVTPSLRALSADLMVR